MARIDSNFESLAGGTTPTTSNTNYTGVTVGAGNTLVTDATITRAGQTSSLRHATASATSQFCYWSNATAGFGSGTQRWMRAYVYFPSLPPSSTTLFGTMTAAFGSHMSVRYGASSQKIVLFDAAGAAVATATTATPTGQWIRLEATVAPGASTTTGAASVQLFYTNPDGTTPDETISVSANNFSTIAPGQHFNGVSNAANGQSFLVSDVAFSDTAAIGPDVSIVTQALTDAAGATDVAGTASSFAWQWAYSITQG